MALVSVKGTKRPNALLHMGVYFQGGSDGAAERELIENSLNKAKDWLRYAPNCWLIYTSRSPKSWSDEVMALPGMKDHTMLVCEINLKNRAGWLPRSAWDWINKSRT